MILALLHCTARRAHHPHPHGKPTLIEAGCLCFPHCSSVLFAKKKGQKFVQHYLQNACIQGITIPTK
eukprot:1138328-Pelagomonas_calceolata.AAC.2